MTGDIEMASETPKLPDRRWYDTVGQMTMALYLSKQLPLQVRQLIAQHLNQAIDTHRKHNRADKHTTSLGPQRTMSLYKAASRQRWYDEEPSLHRALTMMVGMPHPYLSEFASRVLDVTQYWNAQQQYGDYMEQYLLSGAVESILNADEQMLLNQNEHGIRLVMGGNTEHPHSKNTILPIRHHRGEH
jgi:hypothetical protein